MHAIQQANIFDPTQWCILKIIAFFCSRGKVQKQPLEVICKIAVLKKIRKFHGKKPVLESLFNKVEAWACIFIKKRFQHRCFSLKCAIFEHL